jgi:hypothetical protein
LFQYFSWQDNIIYNPRFQPWERVMFVVTSFLIAQISIVRKNHSQTPVGKPAPIISSFQQQITNNKQQTTNKEQGTDFS